MLAVINKKARSLSPSLKFINLISTKLGVRNHSKAEQIFLNVLSRIKVEIKNISPTRVVEETLSMLQPPLKTKPKKIAGRIHYLPTYLHPVARVSFAINFILQAVKKNSSRESLVEKIANELIKGFKKTSLAFSYRNELIKVIKENRPFLRIRRKRKHMWLRKKRHYLRKPMRAYYFAIYPAWFRQGKLDLKKKVRLILRSDRLRSLTKNLMLVRSRILKDKRSRQKGKNRNQK
jgi:ribosomal protein S7